jgi:hypothetical protein
MVVGDAAGGTCVPIESNAVVETEEEDDSDFSKVL